MWRTGRRLRGVGEYLRDHGGTATRLEILKAVGELLVPTDDEASLRSNGEAKWLNDVLWQTTNLVKAGWMTKNGKGVWTITPEGITALDSYPDPFDYHTESIHRFNDWKRKNAEAQLRRRGWLIRGSSVLGADIVPEWLAEGFVSLAASQLRELAAGVTPTELEAIAQQDYGHLKHHELKAKVDEIVAFVTRMRAGDVVLTTSQDQCFVGDVTGDWEYTHSDDDRSNLRRPVEWRNPDTPIDFGDLPEPLPARLQTGSTLVDLTADLDLVDGLTVPVELVDEPIEGRVAAAPRHEHLQAPSAALAAELFVDEAWLSEVRQLLDERRQVIFYGPPGTGKTFIARKLAADLVGAEQVKLVQFHPAYTYEDFFEGFRPTPGSTDGMIGFELRAGPLRQLVNRAREHRDQAFVLIIDEINRANLAKVFGELYFLLEYRDQAVDLLYSSDDEGFTLPKNLYLIGTMNTADRSIALIDAAMRRRFAFVELSPDTEPTRSLLSRWSAHHGLGSVAADLLDRLNDRIDDPDFRIGPSYFMTSTAPDAFSIDRLDRIWRSSILPLLQENHYGEWDSVQSKYRLNALLRAVSGNAAAAADPISPDDE